MIRNQKEIISYLDKIKRSSKSCYSYNFDLADAYSASFLWANDNLPVSEDELRDKYNSLRIYGGRSPVTLFSTGKYDFDELEGHMRDTVKLSEPVEADPDTCLTSLFTSVMEELGISKKLKEFMGENLADTYKGT